MNIRSIATLPSLMSMRHGNVYSNKLTHVKLRNKKVVGALGFEPRSAGVFRLACTWQAHALGLRQVGAPVGHQNHQKTISSSFPCNWSPLYYQVILYPQGCLLEIHHSYDGLGAECSKISNLSLKVRL